jgi:thiosulfate reductase cytochrome b subunit
MLMMVTSGWKIYNASPLYDFMFAKWLTLGGWLGGALAWHFAAMWLLMLNGLAYILYGIFSGHFRYDFFPLSPSAVLRDAWAAATFKLKHKVGAYNAVQKLLYLAVVLMCVGVVVTGLGIWKPVQLQLITNLLGGYGVARMIHFWMMTGIVAFVAVHLALVLLVPSTLLPMITGRAPKHHAQEEAAI